MRLWERPAPEDDGATIGSVSVPKAGSGWLAEASHPAPSLTRDSHPRWSLDGIPHPGRPRALFLRSIARDRRPAPSQRRPGTLEPWSEPAVDCWTIAWAGTSTGGARAGSDVGAVGVSEPWGRTLGRGWLLAGCDLTEMISPQSRPMSRERGRQSYPRAGCAVSGLAISGRGCGRRQAEVRPRSGVFSHPHGPASAFCFIRLGSHERLACRSGAPSSSRLPTGWP